MRACRTRPFVRSLHEAFTQRRGLDYFLVAWATRSPALTGRRASESFEMLNLAVLVIITMVSLEGIRPSMAAQSTSMMGAPASTLSPTCARG